MNCGTCVLYVTLSYLRTLKFRHNRFSCERDRHEWSIVLQRYEDGPGEEEFGGKSIYNKSQLLYYMYIYWERLITLWSFYSTSTACVG